MVHDVHQENVLVGFHGKCHFAYNKKWCQGESTLQWPLLGCHIVLFYRGVHVWLYPTSNFWKKSQYFLHIMLKYNMGKILENNYFI
jgi:hypothetical protein